MSVFYDLNKTPRNILNQAIVRAIASENNGALFDPSDLSTLYQDAAGTTPVTAVEQPVGLMLDKSRGMMLGRELVTNGTFDSGTAGWVSGAGYAATITETGGVCSFTSVNSSARIRPPAITTNIGAMYTVTITILSLATTVIVRPSADPYSGLSGSSLGDFTVNSVGTYTFMFKARTTTTYLWVINNGAIGTVVSLDNISVRELYGYHATQSITASRPTLSARKNILLATEALATQSVATLAAQYTLSFTGTGSVTLSGTVTSTLTGTGTDRVSLTFTPTAGTLTLTVSGSVTKAQLELGTSTGPYQRVNTATDYDTDERYFQKYLRFDGVDDYLNLPYMGLYVGGSASVVVATTVKPSTWSTILAEGAGDPDALYILARYTGTNKLGTFIQDDNVKLLQKLETPITQGITTVLSVVDAGSAITHWVSSMLAGSSNYTRSGTLTSAVTLVGARPYVDTLNGNLYGLIITKSALTDAQRVKCERFLAKKSGVML